MHRSGLRIRTPWKQLFGGRSQLSRYDTVLAVIPMSFLVATAFGTVLSVPVWTAIGAASVLAACAVIDALFLNPPRGPASRRSQF